MSKKNIIKDNKYKVSIITITQFNRFESLQILLELIKNQTYTNIIEWVIVEGSKNLIDKNLNEEQINKLINNNQTIIKFKIKYINTKKNTKLGELRNIGNNECTGDITVCMDDDDYYPPSRVSHAVKKLSDSDFKIAGCSNHYMYDYNLKMLVKLKSFGKFHSINSCMAWKKEYLLNNKHDSTKDFAEEASFTKEFTEPMVQLEPDFTIILSSHNLNTFSKKKFFVMKVNDMNSIIDKIIKEPIEKFIPKNFYERYVKLFDKNLEIDNNNIISTDLTDNYSIYDIVYMCGGFSINWDPNDKRLGGSEQAVVNLSENWVKLGKKVIVYGEIPDIILNGVQYKPWEKFNYNLKYKNLILWRIYGIITTIPFNIKADKIFYDIHDNYFGQIKDVCLKYNKFATNIFVKSNYHKNCFINLVDNNYDKSKLIVIPNGVRLNNFNILDSSIHRNPYRFCYCSCYTRGLDIIISKIWNVIYSYEPRAELHVYYGYRHIDDKNYISYLESLLLQPGVMDHGRQPVEIISREKQMSTFHIYLTNTQAEIDCISIKESVLAGCIPIISNFGVFGERDGIHYDFNDEKQIKMTAINIINLLKNPNLVEIYKNQMNDAKIKIKGWEDIANDWLEYFI